MRFGALLGAPWSTGRSTPVWLSASVAAAC